MGAHNKDVSPVWTRSRHAAQRASVRLRWLRKRRVPRASCNILEAGRRLRSGDPSKTTSVASVAIIAQSHVL
jgi:hypothetical protein